MHVELLQLTEHSAVQATVQVAPSLHDTLPLLPTVTVHSDASQLMLPLSPAVRSQVLPPLQSALQEPAQDPVHVLLSKQENEQLPPEASHPVAAAPTQVQVASASQVH